LFLGVDPYWQKFWWNKLLFEPFIGGMKQPLYAAVAHVLWRTAKDDVIDQVRQSCVYCRGPSWPEIPEMLKLS